MTQTAGGPVQAERLWIAVFGRRNSGKSSLVNQLAGQQLALVSPVAGTTTDPVTKSIEIHGLGPVVLVDTAGYDDVGALGEARVARSRAMLRRSDIALLVLRTAEARALLEDAGKDPLPPEYDWLDAFAAQGADWLLIVNRAAGEAALTVAEQAALVERLSARGAAEPAASLVVDAQRGDGVEAVVAALVERARARAQAAQPSITGELCGAGELVLLVMPQDSQAPAGRLILPQVQTLRELLDKGCHIACATIEQYPAVLAQLAAPPQLIITDSQVFGRVWEAKPEASRLTSFSVLMAAYKGDVRRFLAGTEALETLAGDARILIAEACSHTPQSEDIGRVKLPRLLRGRFGEGLTIDVVSGADLPASIADYDLIIHCGACMFNRAHVLSRLRHFDEADVPVTNYGLALAWFAGILDRVAIPGIPARG